MATTEAERTPISATEQERSEIERISQSLEDDFSKAKLVAPNGRLIDIPEPLLEVLQRAAADLTHGEAVEIIPIHKQLTTNQAADLLNVSRQYLVRLLDEGAIPFCRVGTHRRIRFGDLMDYKKRRDEERRAGLAKLTRESQALGLYDIDVNEVECRRSSSS